MNPGGRPRVLFATHTSKVSGAEIAMERVIDALRDDIDASVLTFQAGPLVDRFRNSGVPVHVVAAPALLQDVRRGEARVGARAFLAGPVLVRQVAAVARVLRRVRPTVVHANSLKSGLVCSLAGRLAQVPVLWHVHDRIASDYLPGHAARAVRFALRHLPSRVIANSHTTRETLGLEDVAVIPPPVPPTPRLAAPKDRPVRFGIVGRVTPWKGQDVLLRALVKVTASVPTSAVIIGAPLFGEEDERYRDQLVALSRIPPLAGRVEFRGFVEDITAELETIHVLVHASTLPEPWGQTVIEGMAAARPVIAAAAGGPTEMITNGVDGVLVPPGDTDALSAAMSTLAEDEDLRERLARHARARAEELATSVCDPRRLLPLYVDCGGRAT